ncbi:MAG: cell division protein FtsA [Nitrospirae bacterium]|nr:MAG: cell division protein FtsA [Nitrospirota bacterium]
MVKSETIVGLDIGTTKICCVVGQPTADGEVEIVGFGTHPSTGLRKGVVVNIDATVESIKRAVEEAELMAGEEIHRCFVGIAGSHIKSFNAQGAVRVEGGEVSEADVERSLEAARAAVTIPMDREILHVVPRSYIVDDQDGVTEPVGMCGGRLESEVHVVTGAVTSAQNLVKSCNRAGLEVADIVLEPIASAEAVLTPEEKELGVALIDSGGGTTDLAIFYRNGLWYTSVLPLGGNNVTHDLSIGLRTPVAEAEKIKRRHGCALTNLVDEGEMIEVPSVGGRPPRELSRQVLAGIIEPRQEEIYALLREEIERSGYASFIAAGAVLTGGASCLEGAEAAAESVLQMPVRLGRPQGVTGLVEVVSDPAFATGVGLVRYGLQPLAQDGYYRPEADGAGLLTGLVGRMKAWFANLF